MLRSQDYYGGLHCNIGKEQSPCPGAKHPLRLLKQISCVDFILFKARLIFVPTKFIFSLNMKTTKQAEILQTCGN